MTTAMTIPSGLNMATKSAGRLSHMVIKLLTISYNGGTGSKILKLFEHTEYTIAINSISRFNFQAFGFFSAIREMMVGRHDGHKDTTNECKHKLCRVIPNDPCLEKKQTKKKSQYLEIYTMLLKRQMK
jgi:hypothetical protein